MTAYIKRYPLKRSPHIFPSSPISVLQSTKTEGHPFPFAPELRQYHMQVLGTPGGGKTKFLEACIRQDITKKHGLLLFDPAGNLYNDVVKWCIQNRLLESRKIILVNPNDPTYAFGFNPLEIQWEEGESDRIRHAKIDRVVDATMNAVGAIQGDEDPNTLPEYNRIMRLILHVLAEQDMTLCDFDVFTNYDRKIERTRMCQASTSRHIRQSWADIEAQGRKDRREYDSLFRAPRNRFAQFVSAGLSCIVGQRNSSLDFRKCMDEGAVVLVHLGTTQGGLTDSEATTFGRLLFNNLTMRAKERLRKDDKHPRPFYCYIDECDRYLNNDVSMAIDKLRQFGLRMILSHQNIGQLDYAGVKVKGAVLGSTAVKIYFSLTADDAAYVARSVYGDRIELDKTLSIMDKPVVVGHNLEYVLGYSESNTEAEGVAVGKGQGRGTGESTGQVLRDQSGFFGLGAGELELSHSSGMSASKSYFTSVAQSEFYSKTMGKSLNPMLIPEIAWLPTQTISSDDQLMKLEQRLSHFPPGECVVVLPHAVSFDAKVPWVTATVVSDQCLADTHADYFKKRTYPTKDAIYAQAQGESQIGEEDQDDSGHGELS